VLTFNSVKVWKRGFSLEILYAVEARPLDSLLNSLNSLNTVSRYRMLMANWRKANFFVRFLFREATNFLAETI
jgi:hypothetical protein